ncbi:MAG: hypothetical protein M3619_00790 [Myxococcota bacterium]|nr:hypothetical protein [Myxococcota bacterium]
MNEHLLFAEDLGGMGAKVDVEIIDSGVALVKGADDSKDMPWIAFRGQDGKPKHKRLALNVTNCKTMQSISGVSAIEQWRGWITLIVVKTSYYDQKTKKMEETEAIRIASKRPQRSGPRQDANTTGSGATQDEPASQLVQPDEEELKLIAERDRKEADRG